jgi:arginine N-succinyltransferase
VRSICEAQQSVVAHIKAPEGSGGTVKALVATGRLADYRCTFAEVAMGADGLVLDPMAAAALAVGVGDTVWHVSR